MKFTVPIILCHGPGRRKVRKATATFSARSIHEARDIVTNGLWAGGHAANVRIKR